MKKLSNKQCEHCKQQFKPKSSKQRFCSRKCFGLSKERIVKVNCKYCNKEFETHQHKINVGKGKFCSMKCDDEYRKSGIVKVDCEYCGKSFTITKCRFEDSRGKYCSKVCFNLARKAFDKYRRENSPNWKGGKNIKCVCKWCKKIFYKEQWAINNGEGKYCSKDCKYNGEIRGRNHPNWQGGITNKPLYGNEWKSNLREMIRKRDDYICQECGVNQNKLEYKLGIHHIDFDKFNNNPNNLISLCKSCHCKTNYHRDNWISYYKNKVKSIVQ